MELERRVEAFVRRRQIFSPGSRIVVACSGGPDSLTLASVLLAMREKWGLELRIAHFEHGIRGEASEADAAFVRDFAEAHGVPCSVVHEDVPAFAGRARHVRAAHGSPAYGCRHVQKVPNRACFRPLFWFPFPPRKSCVFARTIL